MPSGLFALLDDVAGIAKIAAASIDDVAAAAGKAGTKAAGVVIDDAAVTPRYVVGLTPDRELPIIARIAFGSLRNKMLFLLPAALALSALAPWLLPPLLMLGGAFLCFEAAEKLIDAIKGGHDVAEDAIATLTSKEIEEQKVSGAIRTDFILSGEIMAIALGTVADVPLWEQAIVLAVVAVLITVGVYGVVGFIVKMDDIGLHMAQRENGATKAFGRALVQGMPKLLAFLSVVGTAAMLWVGGQIIVHGFGLHPAAWFGLHEGALAWIVDAALSGVAGLAIGSAIVPLHHMWAHRKAA